MLLQVSTRRTIHRAAEAVIRRSGICVRLKRNSDQRLPVWMILLGALLVVPVMVLAYSTGPPDGYAGEPPDFRTCHYCHSSFDLNSGDGGLSLLGVPGGISPGSSYDMIVQLQDPGQARWGFQLTVVDESGQASGTLEVIDASATQLSDNPGTDPDYLKQTYVGTYPCDPGPVQWSFRWTAASSSPVTFYVTGNAANWDGSPGSDFIYSSAFAAGDVTSVRATSWGAIKNLFD